MADIDMSAVVDGDYRVAPAFSSGRISGARH